MTDIIYGTKLYNLDLCELCIFGKYKRVRFNARSNNFFYFLQLIRFVIFGPIPTQSRNGARYF